MSRAPLLPLFILALLPPFAQSGLGAHYTKSPESVTAPLGDEVVFACQTNIAAERALWQHRALGAARWTGAPPSTRVNSKAALSRLTVRLTDETLAGDYRCISWYGVSALVSVSAKLAVAQLGEIPRLPDRHLIAAPGASVLVRCPPPPSEPPATVLYYEIQGGKHVPVSGGADGAVVSARGQNVYTCQAINNLSGQTLFYHHKIIVDAQEGSPKPPTFVEDMAEEVEALVGTGVVLTCGALGRPAPRLSWGRRGAPLPPRAAPKGLLLHITDVQPEDEGVYTCEADNIAGRAERSVRLRVLAPVILVGVGEGDVTAAEGGTARLSCGKAQGLPAPALSWMINGEDVAEDSNVKIFDSELEINPVEKRHAGVVQCFATNILGSDTTVSLLRVVPRQHVLQVGGNEPGLGELGSPRTGNNGPNGRKHSRPKGHHKGTVMIPPSRPNITRLTDESVMVRWSVPHNNGLPIEFFKVQYRDLHQGNGGRSQWQTTNMDIASHVRSYEVTGLQPEHFYKFRIAAAYSNNDNKLGPNSSRFQLKRGTGLAKTIPAPLLMRAEAVSPSEIKLYWEVPPANVSAGKETPVEGYYVYYRPASSAGEYVKAAVEGGRARSLVLRHLAPGSPYEIKLQSFTLSAASDFSAIITQKTLKAPVVEKVPEVGTSHVGSSGSVNGNNSDGGIQVYLIAGSALGALLMLGTIVSAFIMYRKRKGEAPVKQGEAGAGGELANGFLPPSAPPKPPITITANPLLPEGENVDMEMSYISAQNNNCSSRSPRSSAEMVVANSCREELRKQNPLDSVPTRENYV